MSHKPIEERHRALMNTLAEVLDETFNGTAKGADRKVGFALLVYPLDDNLTGTGRVNYIGNGRREDMFVAFKELVARWEGRRVEAGTKQ